MDPTKERAIADRARRKLGLVTVPQLLAIGVSRATISRRVSNGTWSRLGHRTIQVSPTEPDPRLLVMAACLDLGAVASHRTAAWLHGLIARPAVIEVVVPKGRSRGGVPRIPGLVVRRTTSLPSDDVTEVGGIPVTSVARTLLNLASVPDVSDDELRDAVEEAVRRRVATDRWLWWLLEDRRCRGRDGVVRLERVLTERLAVGPTESWLERVLLRLIEEAGLPRPEVQRRVHRRGAFVARVDLAYDGGRIVIEALGYRHHSGREQQSRDAARVNRLQLAGCEVYQFTYDQIVREPERVIAVIAAALAAAGLLDAA